MYIILYVLNVATRIIVVAAAIFCVYLLMGYVTGSLTGDEYLYLIYNGIPAAAIVGLLKWVTHKLKLKEGLFQTLKNTPDIMIKGGAKLIDCLDKLSKATDATSSDRYVLINYLIQKPTLDGLEKSILYCSRNKNFNVDDIDIFRECRIRVFDPPPMRSLAERKSFNKSSISETYQLAEKIEAEITTSGNFRSLERIARALITFLENVGLNKDELKSKLIEIWAILVKNKNISATRIDDLKKTANDVLTIPPFK